MENFTLRRLAWFISQSCAHTPSVSACTAFLSKKNQNVLHRYSLSVAFEKLKF